MMWLLLACTKGDVPDVTLRDADGKSWRVLDSTAPLVVLGSHGVGCPIVRRYSETLQALHLRENVQLFLVNGQDDAAEIDEEATGFGVTAPVLVDKEQVLVKALGFTRTTEVVLVETGSWTVRYRGAIDDRLDYGAERAEVGNAWLDDAIEAVQAGQPVAVPKTEAKGCALYLR